MSRRQRLLFGCLIFFALNHLIYWGPFNLLVCFGQSTTVTGQVKDSNGLPYAGAQMKAQLVFAGTPVSNPTVQISNLAQCRANGFGSSPCNVPFSPNQGPFNLDNAGNLPGGGITLQDNSLVTPASTQWIFTVNTNGNPPPLGTGPQTCSATITISGATQSVSASFSACPALGTTTGGAIYTTTVFDASNPIYAGGVKHDVIIVNDATFNSSSTVTTSVTDPVFFPSDVGKIVFGTNQTGGGTAFYLSTVVLPQGTITTFNNSHSVTVSTTATVTGTGSVAWGTQDDAPAIQAALNAAENANCSALQLPAGKMFVSTGFTNTTATCATADWMSGQRIGITILGMGTEATYLVPLPSYTASVNLFSHVALARDFTVNGLGNSLVTGNPTIIMLQGEANSIFENVKLIGWGGNSSHMTAFQPGGTSSYILNCQCDGAGGTGVNVNSGFNSAWGLSCGDMAGPILSVGPSGIFDDHGSTYFDVGGGTAMISVQGFYNSDGAQWVNAPIVANSASMIQVFSGGEAHISKLNQAKQQSSGTNVNIFRVLTGGKLFVDHISNMTCSASASCTGFQIDSGGIGYAGNSKFAGTANSVNNAGTFIETAPNIFATTTANTGNWIGEANSVNQTAVTPAKLVLSAGWGTTATVTSPAGGDAPIQFTITNSGTGQAASPTITYTFPTPYPVAPFSCTAVQTGGTNATGTFTSSALSATGVTFTFSLTPTAGSTEIVQVQCVTP